MTSTTATAAVSSIAYETETCSRCSGTGQMPYAVYGGACFKCNRRGVTMTRAGRTAHAKVTAWAEENLMVPASSLKVGDRVILSGGKVQTVTGIETTLGQGNGISRSGVEGTDTFTETWSYGRSIISTKGIGMQGPAHMLVRRAWDRDSLTAVAQLVGHLKGAIITYADTGA